MAKTSEIFQRVSERLIVGIMLHEQLADYYDFLNLRGFKRLHEYRFFCESAAMRGLHRYFINHYNMLIAGGHPANPAVIPDGWSSYTRQQVTADVKRRAVRDGMNRWISWEHDTKKLYEHSYTDLCNLGEVAAANKIKEMISEVDQELKYVERLCIDLDSSGYDLTYILMMQDALHEAYAAKTRDIGIDIC